MPTLSGHSAPEILNTSINRVEDTLKAFIANRIPQNKKPGIRPIGVIQEIAGKFKMNITKKNVQQARIFTSCAGQNVRAEAGIHAMCNLFQIAETEPVLLVDAENAFNSINRTAVLHNIFITCPILPTFVSNCYLVPAQPFRKQ